MERILKDVRVLDFTQVVAGPYCTRMLADLGADVVKVDRVPQGATPVRANGSAANNAGKRSVAVDLKSERGKALVKELARGFDVVVENFTPGVMARLGLDYASLAADNPRLIYASISGFGQSGTFSWRRAYGATAHAEAGFLDVLEVAHHDTEPLAPGLQVADVVTGMNAFSAILAALYDRERTGLGQQIDVTLMESQLAFLGEAAVDALAGVDADTWEPFRHPVHRSNDNRYFTINIGGPVNWRRIMDALGGDQTAPPGPADAANQVVADLVAQRSSSDVMKGMERTGAPYGLVMTLHDAVAHPFFAEREAIVRVDDPIDESLAVVRTPLRFSRSETGPLGPPPLAGEHTDEILRDELNRSPDEVAALVAEGVVGTSTSSGSARQG